MSHRSQYVVGLALTSVGNLATVRYSIPIFGEQMILG
jgi:hypothetical protein